MRIDPNLKRVTTFSSPSGQIRIEVRGNRVHSDDEEWLRLWAGRLGLLNERLAKREGGDDEVNPRLRLRTDFKKGEKPWQNEG